MDRLSPVESRASRLLREYTEKRAKFTEQEEEPTEDETEEEKQEDIEKTLTLKEIINAQIASKKVKYKAFNLVERKTKDFGTYEMVSADYPVSHDDLVYFRVRSPLEDSQGCIFRIGQVAEVNNGALSHQKFQAHPMNAQTKFQATNVENIMLQILEDVLDGKKYDPDFCRFKARILSDQIKDRVKELFLPRYRIISTVFMGEIGQQSMRVASRCTWDNENDNYAECSYRSNTLWAVAIVFGVYYE